MQDEKLFGNLNKDGRNFELWVHWILKHHVQEILNKAELFLRLDDWQTSIRPECNSRQHRHLGNEFDSRQLALDRILDVERVVDEA